uniref:uncharacterized protein LOC118539553 n=1 Tax=Halichoerus grypus TaxID=9711 RepID=UPI001658F907|nr:uncharacterized protein LOC118539553 [Halichoerus grypus]
MVDLTFTAHSDVPIHLCATFSLYKLRSIFRTLETVFLGPQFPVFSMLASLKTPPSPNPERLLGPRAGPAPLRPLLLYLPVPLGSYQGATVQFHSEKGTEGLRVRGRSPTRGALRSPELLRRAQAGGQGHGVCSPDRWGWSYRPTSARAPRIQKWGGRAAERRHQLRPGAAATCIRTCAERFRRRCRTQERALRMRPFSALLKTGSAGAVFMHSLDFVTLVSQDLKVG